MRKRSSSLGVVVLAAFAAAACGGSSKPPPAAPVAATPEAAPPLAVEAEPPPALPAIPATPARAPDGLIVTGVGPSPASFLPAIAAYVDAVAPGKGADLTIETMIAAAAADGADLRGFDETRPLRILVLDPGRFPKPVIAVIGVRDERAVAALAAKEGVRYQLHRGHAAIGSFEALSAAGGYALTTLLDRPATTTPVIEIDVAYVMDRYGAVLDMVLAGAVEAQPPDQRAMIGAMVEGMQSRLRQIERADLTLDVRGGLASAVLRVFPRAGSGLAGFAAAQVPASFAQLDVLPPGLMVIGGRLDWGSLMADFFTAMEPQFTRYYGSATPDVLAAMRRWASIKFGEFGGSVDLAGVAGTSTSTSASMTMSMSMLMDVPDPDALAAAWRDQAKAQVKASGALFKAKMSTATHRGTKLSQLTVTPSPKATAEERAAVAAWGSPSVQVFGIAGKTAVMAMGPRGLAAAKALIDRVRGGGKPAASATLAPVLDLARRRRESAIFAVDVPSLVALGARSWEDAASGATTAPAAATKPAAPVTEPAVLAFGTDGGALAIRFTLPAAQLASTAAMLESAKTPAPQP